MKFLLDLLPVVVLFGVFKTTGDMFNATAAAMVASIVQILIYKLKKMPIKPIHWFGLASIVVLGGISIYLHDIIYLKWKFTIVEWVLATAVLLGQYVFKKNMLQALIGSELSLPDVAWRKLALSYAAFFTFMGTLNLYIAYNFNDNVWLNFKMYGTMGLMLVFFVWQSTWLGKYLVDGDEVEQ